MQKLRTYRSRKESSSDVPSMRSSSGLFRACWTELLIYPVIKIRWRCWCSPLAAFSFFSLIFVLLQLFQLFLLHHIILISDYGLCLSSDFISNGLGIHSMEDNNSPLEGHYIWFFHRFSTGLWKCSGKVPESGGKLGLPNLCLQI